MTCSFTSAEELMFSLAFVSLLVCKSLHDISVVSRLRFTTSYTQPHVQKVPIFYNPRSPSTTPHQYLVLCSTQHCSNFRPVHVFYVSFLPARRSKRSICYSDVAGWLSVTAGIVSKWLNLSWNFLHHLVAPSLDL